MSDKDKKKFIDSLSDEDKKKLGIYTIQDAEPGCTDWASPTNNCPGENNKAYWLWGLLPAIPFLFFLVIAWGVPKDAKAAQNKSISKWVLILSLMTVFATVMGLYVTRISTQEFKQVGIGMFFAPIFFYLVVRMFFKGRSKQMASQGYGTSSRYGTYQPAQTFI